MTGPWRLLVLAAAIDVTMGIGVAAAQTVIVRNAPPGSTVELVFDSATIGTAKADSLGDAILPVKRPANAANETSAHVYVDQCQAARRVLLVEPGLQPPPPPDGCTRHEVAGLFIVRLVTTFLVDVGANPPTVWLRQGSVPSQWLLHGEEAEAERARSGAGRQAPKGLVVSGGGGLGAFRDAVALACGNVQDCTGKDLRITYTGTAAVWFFRFLGAEAGYVRPAVLTVNGNGSTFHFNSSLDPQIFTVVAKGAAPIGPVRLYGEAGANYHRATLTLNQTIDDQTVTVNDTPTTIKGGTQSFITKTAGWGYVFGGGIEGWISNKVAIYGEAGRMRIKGDPTQGVGGIDERLTFILGGVRLHIGG